MGSRPVPSLIVAQRRGTAKIEKRRKEVSEKNQEKAEGLNRDSHSAQPTSEPTELSERRSVRSSAFYARCESFFGALFHPSSKTSSTQLEKPGRDSPRLIPGKSRNFFV